VAETGKPKPDEAAPEKVRGNRFDSLIARARKLGNTKAAYDIYFKASEIDPTRAEPHSGMGWRHMEEGNYDQAIAEFLKASKLHGVHCEAYAGLGEAYMYKKNRQEAARFYQAYLQECPEGPEAPVARNNLNKLNKPN
jgi:tetratricopeptide (TPR) repeat protein